MPDAATNDRVNDLVAQFKSLSAAGKLQDAADALRNASSLDPDNEQVKAGLQELSKPEVQADPLKLVRSYIEDPSEDCGKSAVAGLSQTTNLSAEDARSILELCLPANDNLKIKRQLVGALFTLPTTPKALTEVILDRPTEIFKAVWSCGPNALRGLTTTTLAATAWVSEEDRIKAERDIFMLLLAKLLEPGLDNPELAMSAIARMLAADAGRFRDIIEPESFDIMLSALSIDNDVALRSQATLAVAKILEADPEGGQKLLTDGVVNRVAQQGTDDLIIAFSAAAAVFPVVPNMAAALFMTDGFLADLNRMGAKANSLTLRRAALELLSAACVSKECRQAITEQSTDWLEQQAQDKKGRISTLAALVLAKTSASPENPARRPSFASSDDGRDGLAAIFKDDLTDSDAAVAETAIEGLAYRSTSPTVKEELANDPYFLKRLITTLDQTTAATSPTVFGGLTILSNLTQYPPVLSAEQKRIAQLKAYANQSKPDSKLDPLEEDARVTERCGKVLDAGVASVLVKFAKKASPSLFGLISSIIVAMVKHPRHRGKMAQQGLFDTALRLASSDSVTTAVPKVKQEASLALAQMLIRLNPALLFYNTAVPRPLPAAVSALDFLLTPAEVDGTSTVNYFSVVEALKALTNMAAMADEVQDDAPTKAILAQSWDAIEGYLESDVAPVRQAATECVCNLCTSDAATQLYTRADDEGRGSQRMAVLLRQSLFDGERGTRLAAGGALAAILGAGGVANFVAIKGSTGLLRKALMFAKDDWLDTQSVDEVLRVLAILQAVVADPRHGQAVRGQLNSWSSSEDDALDGGVVGILKELEASPAAEQARACLGLFRNTAKAKT